MKTEKVQKLSPFKRFCYWIIERESIRLKKEAGEPKPWTDDTIFQSFRFCNVRRMDDKVSKWLLKNWFEPNFDHKNMLLAISLARFVNKPESLEQIGFPKKWDPKQIKRILRSYKAKGNTVFSTAYMVAGGTGKDKIESVVDHYCGSLIGLSKLPTESMEEYWKIIYACHGFGSFMAGQVVADLRHAVKGSWDDRNDWAPMGPGSQRGLNRLCNREIRTPWTQEQFLVNLKELRRRAETKLPKEITSRLEMHDWQNCLCETDKFNRVLNGEGRPKQKYKGAARCP